MKILVDMNLSPDWIPVLEAHGWSAVHWSSVGDPRSPDRVIMDWALANGCVVFTHDLDFGTMLALTHAAGPSVLQVRSDSVIPSRLAPVVVAALLQHEVDLVAGALVIVDETRRSSRVLPI